MIFAEATIWVSLSGNYIDINVYGYTGSASFSGPDDSGHGTFTELTSGDGDSTMTNHGSYVKVKKDYRDGDSSYHLDSSVLSGDSSNVADQTMGYSLHDTNI